MLNEEHKYLIEGYLKCAKSIYGRQVVPPNDTFDNDVRKIKDLMLNRRLSSEDVHEYIKESLSSSKIDSYYIGEYFKKSGL